MPLARSHARKTGARNKSPAVARYESSKLMWKSNSGFQSNMKMPVSSKMQRDSRSRPSARARKASPPMMAERMTGGTQPARML